MLIDKHSDILRSIITHFGSASDIATALTFRLPQVQQFFIDKKVDPPAGVHILAAVQVLINVQQGSNFLKAEDVERTHDVYVVPQSADPTLARHIRVDRSTEEIEYFPADRVAQMVAPAEIGRPGMTSFVGDLFQLLDFAAPTLRPYGEAAQFHNSKVAPGYSYAGLVMFCSLHGAVLAVRGTSTENISDTHAAVVGKLSAMPIAQYLEMQTSFYVHACELVRKGPGYLLHETKPVRQIGHTTVENKPFFQAYPEIPAAQRPLYLYREGNWRITLPTVLATEQALKQLSVDRSWRGEDKGRYSALTRAHAAGGHLSSDRYEVCSALSLVVPLLKQGIAVLLELKSIAHVPLFDAALRALPEKLDIGKVRYKATAAQLQNTFGSKYADFLCDPVVKYHTVSVSSNSLPTMATNENADDKWLSLFPAWLPSGDYTVVTKVPPKAADTYNVFYFNSAHTFDFVVSTRASVSVSVREASLMGGKVVLEMKENPLIKVDRTALLQRQYADNRRKLSYFTEFKGPKYDPRMNLWLPIPVVSKAKRNMLVPELVTAEGEMDVSTFDYAAAPPPPGGAAAPAGDPGIVPLAMF